VFKILHTPGLAKSAELNEKSAPGLGVILILAVPSQRNKCRKYHLRGRTRRPGLSTSQFVISSSGTGKFPAEKIKRSVVQQAVKKRPLLWNSRSAN
jgi:hypothetical protein